ncbi:MAG: serine protease [Acetobacteraceae bacterium]
MPSRRPSRLALSVLALAFAAGCARLPAGDAAGTPAGATAARGFGVVSDGQGALLGAATAVAPELLVTNAHVVGTTASVRLTRGDGGAVVAAAVVRRVTGADLVLLRAERPAFDAPACLGSAPATGEPVWAVGAPRLGSAVASGVVARASARMDGFGAGFTARMPALMGHSGGPVVDRDGCLVGIATALVSPGAAAVLGAFAGVDLAGIAGQEREVFALGLPVVAEALAPP